MINANIQPYEYPLHTLLHPSSGHPSSLIFVTPLPPVMSEKINTRNIDNRVSGESVVTPLPKMTKIVKKNNKKKLNTLISNLVDLKQYAKKEIVRNKIKKEKSASVNRPSRLLPTSYEDLNSPVIRKRNIVYIDQFPRVFTQSKANVTIIPHRSYPTSFTNLGKPQKDIKVFSL